MSVSRKYLPKNDYTSFLFISKGFKCLLFIYLISSKMKENENIRTMTKKRFG